MDTAQVTMILTALKAGWTVSMNDNDELVFTKDQRKMTTEERTEVLAEGFSAKFLHTLIGSTSASASATLTPVKKPN
jgi:hypothetical protein